MNILEEIVQHKRKEVAEREALYPVKLLEQSRYFQAATVSLKEYLLREDKSGIIAEIKRKSPSQGVIQSSISVEDISIGYMQAGASALSVLTDEKFFGGSSKDLEIARKFNFCPILRKDFVISEYQIIEAKSIGADAILLIAAALSFKELQQLHRFATSLGLEVLVEIHEEHEIQSHLKGEEQLVGINSRNLKTMGVSKEHLFTTASALPQQVVKVAESGMSSAEDIFMAMEAGYSGFLMGTAFMKQAHPALACQRVAQQVIRYKQAKMETV